MRNLEGIKFISKETTLEEMIYLQKTFFPTFPLDVLYNNNEKVNALLVALVQHNLTEK